MKFISEYEFNNESFKEDLRVGFNRGNLMINIIDIIIVIYLTIMCIFSFRIITLIALIIVLISQLIIIISKNIYLDKYIKKFSKRPLEGIVTVEVDIKKKKILLNEKMNFDFTQIQGVLQNKKWVIIYTDKKNILMKKDSFIKGTPKECYTLLKKEYKNIKKNK